MAFPRKYTPSFDDIKLIVELIKERDRLYSSAEACSRQIEELTRARAEYRRQARLLTCETIAEKFELNKDVVYCVSKCISFKPEIRRIDPSFFESKQGK